MTEEMRKVAKRLYTHLSDESEEIETPGEAIQVLELTKYHIQRKASLEDVAFGRHLDE